MFTWRAGSYRNFRKCVFLRGPNPLSCMQLHPDVVILCYSADAPQSLVHTVTYWLPTIRGGKFAKLHWVGTRVYFYWRFSVLSPVPPSLLQPYLPVCLCGTNEDRISASSKEDWALALQEIASAARQSGINDIPDDVEPDESQADLRRRCLEAVLMLFEVRLLVRAAEQRAPS